MPKRLGYRQALLLLEATRRYNRFHHGENILSVWTGLGYISEYKTVIDGGYMVSATHSYPRCKRWFCLTGKGAAIVKKLLSYGINSIFIDSTPLDILVDKINYAYKVVQSDPEYV